jgi:two-component system, cell cycle sensor histidine kinase and response regulator CckA
MDAAHANGAVRRLNVLLIDDNEAVLAVTAELLRCLGHNVIATAVPGAALEVACESATPLDLLVTDVVMPEMNGRELSDRVAKVRPGTPTIFISGYHDDPALAGRTKPGVAFVRKPFGAKDLECALRAVTCGTRELDFRQAG